ncbi:MAG: hypothetical protein JXR76_29885 [Deltaproteobacteria bacterium]|nr:hypothetical protein [Deltaproteobacteria bacterium]
MRNFIVMLALLSPLVPFWGLTSVCPGDCPANPIVLGNARVTAWRALRLDLDSLNHGEVHPALVHQWLEAASPDVLQMLAEHAMDPTLVLDAARILAQRKLVPTSFFSRLATKWAQSPRREDFLSLRVLAKEKAYIIRLTGQLRARSDVIRINAASILALGAHSEGYKALLAHVASCGPQLGTAMQTLAKMGGEAERIVLEKSIRAGCEASVLHKASGEILFRERFPLQYDLILRRDPGETRYQAENGMYGSWFDFIRFYEQQGGAKRFGAFPLWIKSFRQLTEVWPLLPPEVSQRNVDALIEFMDNATTRIQSSPSVLWPMSFSDAMKNVQDESKDGFGKRVSAAIRILEWTSGLPGRVNGKEYRPFSILSPLGDRAKDGNWRSSWQGKSGDTLVIEWFPPSNVEVLWLASSCAYQPQAKLNAVRMTVFTADGEVQKDVSLNPEAMFYQRIVVHQKAVQKISLQIMSTTQNAPICITELNASGF